MVMDGGLESCASTARRRDLVGAIYDAALEPALWPNALVHVSDAMSCDRHALSLV
jgi:hypothetical protein